MSTNAELIAELRSAAVTLRTPTGSLLPAQDRITAELIERAADALEAANHAPRPPEWSELPAWVHFIAMDSDGRWHGFGREPYVEDSFGGTLMGWDVIDGGSMAYRDYNAPHVAGWRESMQKRPSPTVSITVAGAPLSAEQKANILHQLEREGLS